MQNLKTIINRIDHRGYKAYKQLKGSYNFDNFTLYIDHVQGDPFAAPSKLRARVYQSKAKFDPNLFSNKSRRIALQDFITRVFDRTIKARSTKRMGSGKSGLLDIDCGRQQILERTSCCLNQDFIEVCFYAGLPARGRRILGSECITLLTSIVPQAVSGSMFYSKIDKQQALKFVQVNEDQDYLRAQLSSHNLVAFIANDSILPRRSGISDRPLPPSEAIPFKSPPQLETTLTAPHAGKIKGMGLPAGITLIIGGGFHGKTTLLSSIEEGVYNHIPGDGREYAVTIGSAVKIRAEEGRNVQKVNISPFINNLPFGKNTQKFSTANASGSTSQAANIIEALELETGMLLLDEDTSATNFLIRDEVMQKIVSKDKEPITPFIDQVQNMRQDYGTSTIMVMGGAGDYFEVAEHIILMDSYIPRLVTSKAKDIISQKKDKRKKEASPVLDRSPKGFPNLKA
ncbi:MAG: ABC-ATPase domain-containing protein [Actinomycetota bacterium]|nr:ABC-ATPase domain-containing protein [Actinomycetota bacterium]